MAAVAPATTLQRNSRLWRALADIRKARTAIVAKCSASEISNFSGFAHTLVPLSVRSSIREPTSRRHQQRRPYGDRGIGRKQRRSWFHAFVDEVRFQGICSHGSGLYGGLVTNFDAVSIASINR